MTDRAYCPECRGSRDVVEVFAEDTGDSRRTVTEYVVTILACGHSLNHTTREYPSPLQQAGPPRAASLPDPFKEDRDD